MNNVTTITRTATLVLQKDLGINEQEAYLTLADAKPARRKPMKEIAQAVILCDELKRPAARPVP